MKQEHCSTSLAAAWAINSLAYSIVYPFIPIYLHEERNIPMDVVGTIFPLMGLAVILAPPLSGWLTDRIGRNFMMQSGQGLRGAIFLVLALFALRHAPFWAFALLLMVNSAVGTFFQVAADSYLADFTTQEERPRVYSKIRIGTNIGWAVGPMLGAFLARTPFSLMFAMTALLCIAGMCYTARCCPEIRPAGAPLPAKERAEAKEKVTVLTLLKNPFLIKLLGSSFLLFLLTSQLYSVLSVYATGVVGVGRDTLGLVYSVNGFTIIFLQMGATQLADRFRCSQSFRLVAGSLLYLAGYFSLAFCAGGVSLGCAVFVLTLGELFVQPALYTQISRLAPPGAVGRSMAALGLVRGIGFAVGPWIGSIVFEWFASSPVILWGILSSFALVAGIGFLTMRAFDAVRKSV